MPARTPTATTRLLGNSPPLRATLEAVARAAAAPRSTVLVLGESGSGKELVARALHEQSARAGKPFVALNCASLSGELMEAELFGYAPGAFTGASARGREGLLAAAEGGTLLLDEIGELDGALQARLLRVLQERCFRPVGADEDRPMDVRIVAATHRDLGARVASGSFREDLYYRLNVLCIRVPALRERPEDVPLLAEAFLCAFEAETGLACEGFSPEARARLMRHAWPGNVRELRNCTERALLAAAGRAIGPEDLGLDAPAQPSGRPGLLLPVSDRSLESVERALIELVLEETGNNRSAAARLLGINRATLYTKLRAWSRTA